MPLALQVHTEIPLWLLQGRSLLQPLHQCVELLHRSPHPRTRHGAAAVLFREHDQLIYNTRFRIRQVPRKHNGSLLRLLLDPGCTSAGGIFRRGTSLASPYLSPDSFIEWTLCSMDPILEWD